MILSILFTLVFTIIFFGLIVSTIAYIIKCREEKWYPIWLKLSFLGIGIFGLILSGYCTISCWIYIITKIIICQYD